MKKKEIHIHPTFYLQLTDHWHVGISEVFPRNALLLLFPSLSEVMFSLFTDTNMPPLHINPLVLGLTRHVWDTNCNTPERNQSWQSQVRWGRTATPVTRWCMYMWGLCQSMLCVPWRLKWSRGACTVVRSSALAWDNECLLFRLRLSKA